jgi:hypothetical protein
MSKPLLHPALRLVISGVLSLVVLYLLRKVGRADPRWLIGLAGAAAGAFVLLVPVLVRGDSWQKMVAGALLFLPCFGLALAVYGVLSSL